MSDGLCSSLQCVEDVDKPNNETVDVSSSGSGSVSGGGGGPKKRLREEQPGDISGAQPKKKPKGGKKSDGGDRVSGSESKDVATSTSTTSKLLSVPGTASSISEQGAGDTNRVEERRAVHEQMLTSCAVTEEIIEQASRQVYGFVQTNIAYMLEAFKPHLEVHTKKCAEAAQRDLRMYSQALIPKAVGQLKEKLSRIRAEEQSAPVSSATVDHFQESALKELSGHVSTLLQTEMEKFLSKIGLPFNEDGNSDPSLEMPLVSAVANQVLKGVKEHFAESVSTAAALNQVSEEVKGHFDAALSNTAVTVQSIKETVVESVASRVTDAVLDRLRAAKAQNDGSSSAAVMVTEVTDPVVTKVTGGVLKAVTEASNMVVKVGELVLDGVDTNIREALAAVSKENAETHSTLIRLEQKVDALTARNDDVSVLLKSVISQTQMMSALLANAAGGGFIAGISNPSMGGTSSSSGAGGTIPEAVTAAGGAAVAGTASLQTMSQQLGVHPQPISEVAVSVAARTHQERKHSLQSLFKTL